MRPARRVYDMAPMPEESASQQWKSPLLPRGEQLFESLPMSAVVIEALGPAVGDGVARIDADSRFGLVIFRDGRLAGALACESGRVRDGEDALQLLLRWSDATVSAERLAPALLGLLPMLVTGEPCYDDLRLEWVDWRGLVDDLRRRGGMFAVELDTASGRGLLALRDGEELLATTGAADRTLDDLAADRRGTIRVRRAPAPAGSVEDAVSELFGRAQPLLGAAAVVTEQRREVAARTLAELAPRLKQLARERLLRSADRVERLVDDAVARAESVELLADRVGRTPIRGVMQTRMLALAGDMRALADGEERAHSFLPA
jgi:hypothetical protein